ncbi:germinal-center associated nuclear protein [Leguminivora glycinivorella]|uniref:germinal-center associated nuclear protein n=1 Tax=Leguminivora glycinivorella TaxID=1035111 RepID=UPI00200F7A22|nr:germinal-center associated nuclear protein [Leguminivora glycinivorella]
MSYFEYYSKNSNQPLETKTTVPKKVYSGPKNKPKSKISNGFNSETTKDTESIKGTCLSMCPEDEVKMRDIAKMVHVLEVINGRKVLVKCYSRSAADSTVAVPRLLRPYEVLQDTVRHLLLQVAQNRDTNMLLIYDFVSDRLRAVRQDMTVQRLSAKECMTLLEPMIRFHVYFGYKLCEYPIKAYDPVLNKKLLLECLKWFLSCSDSIDQTPKDLTTEIEKLNLNHNLIRNKNQDIFKCDKELIESLYILCNLDDVHPMYRYLNLANHLKSHRAINLAYKIATANWRGNFVKVCKLLHNLCPLTYCALCLHLPTLQRHALPVISTAYNSKQLTVPLSALRTWLRFDSDAAAASVCAHYGLAANQGAVRFSKADFKADVATHQPSRLLLLDQKMDLSHKHVFTYHSEDYTYGA